MLAALEKIMIRGRAFVLETFGQLQGPQVWALDASGDVLGHILTISDEALHSAPDWLVAPLALALDEPWSDAVERGSWTAAYADALRALANKAEADLLALVERDVLRDVAGLDSGTPGRDRKV